MFKLFFLVLVLVFAKTNCYKINKPVLYFPNDTNIVIANVSTYQNILFDQNKVTIFQFFNSWCGHCVRFAPIWKAFAKNISNWNPVINVVALDCVDEGNIEVCRNYSIYSYPSIRLFWHHVNSSDNIGESLIDIKPQVEFIKEELVKFVVQNSNQNNPSNWPNINKIEINNKQDLNDLLKKNNNEEIINLAIVESNSTYFGQNVILEFSKYQDNVKITSLNAINLRDFGLDFDSSKETALVKINSDNSLELLMKLPLEETKVNVYVDYLNEKYFNSVLNLNKTDKKPDLINQAENRNNKQPEDVPMYINDLYGAVKYTLYQQIPLKKSFNGTQLNILKRFFDTIEKYFPDQDTKFINFIQNLNKFLQAQEQELKIEDYLKFLENNKYNFDSKYEDWITCKGSSPNYRGYTCSLWSLFHSLTVNEYLKEKNTQKWVNLHEVLFTMRDYIGNFFSCTDCAQHFLGMSSNLENELKYPNSSVLWLWNAHNTVNKRLAGTETEDPEHVKSIYPYQKSCPNCYSKKDFNEKEIFNYLIDRYGKIELNKFKQNHSRISSKLINESQLSFSDSNKFNHTDYSICFALYFLTTLILMTVFFFYLPLRIKRKAKITKSKFLEA